MCKPPAPRAATSCQTRVRHTAQLAPCSCITAAFCTELASSPPSKRHMLCCTLVAGPAAAAVSQLSQCVHAFMHASKALLPHRALRWLLAITSLAITSQLGSRPTSCSQRSRRARARDAFAVSTRTVLPGRLRHLQPAAPLDILRDMSPLASARSLTRVPTARRCVLSKLHSRHMQYSAVFRTYSDARAETARHLSMVSPLLPWPSAPRGLRAALLPLLPLCPAPSKPNSSSGQLEGVGRPARIRVASA